MTEQEEKKATDEHIDVDESKVQPILEQLLALVQDEDLDEEEVLSVAQDPYFVRRCLIACYNNEKKAFKMAATAIRWRSKVKPSKITPDDFPTAASQELFMLGGHAKNGWPVAFGIAARWNPWRCGTAEYSRMIAFLMESCERALDPNDPYARIYFVFDMKGMSKLNSDLRKVAELSKFAATYYPERVVGLVLNADIVTFALWTFISPLLDRRTRERVTILRSNGANLLDEKIGLDQIGPRIGGRREKEWPVMSMQTRAVYEWGRDAEGNPSRLPLKQLETDETEDMERPESPELIEAMA